MSATLPDMRSDGYECPVDILRASCKDSSGNVLRNTTREIKRNVIVDVTGLKQDTQYSCSARLGNLAGNSDRSSEVTIKTEKEGKLISTKLWFEIGRI
jgi:hypothetical protein